MTVPSGRSADRSVGHIDCAIRRRFAFVDVPPDVDALDGEVGIDWPCYANGQAKPDEELRNWPIGKDGYPELIPAALLHECRLLLRRGLRRPYVRRQRVDTSLRGRLKPGAQATHCYGAGGGVTDLLHPYGFGANGLPLSLNNLWENVVLRMKTDTRRSPTLPATPVRNSRPSH
ncbi:hypothetical protein AB0B21_03605 [Streptomyces rimosus]|uniref:hypothetical protein n=1 Tax=Streptomyces rimosus TaxID=1927 RepID=UPI000517DAB1|nr:hypothetical protein [Streptomyces rimosus]